MTASRKKPRMQVRRMLSVYAGQALLGTIEEGTTTIARDLDGNK
jgi:hypothetical protein